MLNVPMPHTFLFPVLAEGVDLDFCSAIACELRGSGHNTIFVAGSPRIARQLKKRHENVHFLFDGFEDSPPSDAAVSEIERTYEICSLEGFVFPEHTYDWGRGYSWLLRRCVHAFRFFERLFAAQRVDFVVNNVGAEVARRVAMRVGRAFGARDAIFDFAAIHGRFVIASHETGFRLPPVPATVDPGNMERAQAVLLSITTQRKPFAPVSNLGLQRKNFKGFIGALERRKDQEDVSVERLVAERARRVFRRAVGTAIYEQKVPGEPYIFFPLHLFNDSVLTVRAPQFQRQEDVVRYISERSLPHGTMLYVKPHIGARDAYAVNTMLRIRAMPRVRLLEPTINPHDVIEHAAAVIVINSTVGFEAVLHRRPTVVLGNPFYRGFGLTEDVTDLSKLAEHVGRAMRTSPSETELLRFLAHYEANTHVGTYGDVAEANVARVAATLAAFADANHS